MDAYKVLKSTPNVLVDESKFNGLLNSFQQDYLFSNGYFEKAAKHRNPGQVKTDFLQDLNDYLLQIQARPEMRDYDKIKNSSGPVNSKIAEIWDADKNLATIFQAVEEYSKLRLKSKIQDFNTVAVHFAEYHALADLYRNFDRITDKQNGFELTDNNLYNLFVSADEDAWDGKPFLIEHTRCVKEYTDPEINEKYGKLSVSAIEALKKFPCLFAYEDKCEKAPKYGKITNVTKAGSMVCVEYEIIEIQNFLSLEDFNVLRYSLAILHDWELSRTHWAVKNVHLENVLLTRGISLKIVNGNNIEQRPIIFISYSWDNEEHKSWVLRLAEKLCSDGIDVQLDRFELKLGRNLTHFIEESIRKSSRIIIVFTPNYRLKADHRKGGVGFEYSIINNQAYESIARNEKIIPILRNGNYKDAIPDFMQQYIHLDMSDDSEFETKYIELVRAIYDEPEFTKPKLGVRPRISKS